jgi:DNA-binding winged helix-turn-helix (wHTH) protein
MRLNYKHQLVNAVWEIIAVYFENHTTHINTLRVQ